MFFSCTNCSLGRPDKPCAVSGSYFIPGSTQARVMIIGDFPHGTDLNLGKPFTGSLGTELTKLLNTYNIPLSTVYVTTLVKCCPQLANKKEGTIKKEQIDKCFLYLQEEIANVNPELIVLCGEKAFHAFYPDLKFTTERGRILDHAEYDMKMIPIYNPLSTLVSSKFDPIIRSDFETIDAFINKKENKNSNKKDYILIKDNISMLHSLVKRLSEVETFAFDIETHGKGLFDFKLLAISFSWKKDTGVSIPIYAKDQAKADKIQDVVNFCGSSVEDKIVKVNKKGEERITTKKRKVTLDEVRAYVEQNIPEYKQNIADCTTVTEIKFTLNSILDKNPPLYAYWGDKHDEVMSCLKQIMSNNTPKGAHNGAYDVNRLRGLGIIVNNYAWDTILMHHLLDEERPHDLDELSELYTQDGGYKKPKDAYLKTSETSWANIPMDMLLPYNAEDSDVTCQLYYVFKDRLQKEGRLWDLFVNHTMPVQRILLDMSFRGSDIDTAWLKQKKVDINKEMSDLKLQISDLITKRDPDFYIVDSPEEQKAMEQQMKDNPGQVKQAPKFLNINSTQQLVSLFKNVYNENLTKTTATGLALDSAVLDKISKHNKVASLLLRYKALKKLESTYIDSILENIDSDGKLHTEFKVFGTATGRLSSSNPNCFDDKTEVLTDTGFKLFSDLKNTDKVAQWENGEITFDYPISYIKKEYKGNLVHLHNQHIDICGTPDHRCLLLSRKNKEKVIPLNEYKSDMKQLHGGLYNKGTLHFDKNFITILVATQADGSYDKYCIDFSFYKKRKYNRLTAALKALGCIYKEYVSPKTKRYRVRLLKADPIYSKIRGIMPEKKFTYMLMNMDNETRDLFIQELDYWDGCITRSLMYASQHKQNTDVIQSLLALNNRRSICRERTLKPSGYRSKTNTYYFLDSVGKQNYSYTTNIHKEDHPYDGFVYCVTMPKDTVVIRRNLKVCITKNCQNCPGEMKPMFIPPPGYLCVNVDQSAAELHVLAWLADDKKMMDIFEKHRDLHKETAAGAFNKKLEDVTPDERKIAKRLGFGVAYGISGRGLAAILEPEGVKITENQGNKYIEQWKKTYPRCAAFLNKASRDFTNYGFLETPFGRRRHKYKKYLDKNKESASARQACNFPIQSTASDIQLYEMVHMYPDLIKNGILPILTVHDSITMYCPKDKLFWLRDFYLTCTCRRFPNMNNLLMYTEMEVGRNYGEHIKLPYDCDFEKWKEENKFLFE